MEWKLVLAGVGGQGVLFATRVLSETALALGYDVIGSETHGMSQRGGSVVSHLKIGPFQSPLVRRGTADVVLAFDPDEAYRNFSFARRGGVCVVNNDRPDFPDARVQAVLDDLGVRVLILDADRIAADLGAPRTANVTLIGFALAYPDMPLPAEAVRETLARVSPYPYREINLQAFERGYQADRK